MAMAAGHSSKKQALAAADGLCRERGARFTSMRREVYAFLLEQTAPLSAYDILAQIEKRVHRKLAPPTVYRALEFLLEQGLIHRLESTHAYLTCDHPGEHHQSLYLVCTVCGTTQELDGDPVSHVLADQARAVRFRPQRQVMELQGLCRNCDD